MLEIAVITGIFQAGCVRLQGRTQNPCFFRVSNSDCPAGNPRYCRVQANPTCSVLPDYSYTRSQYNTFSRNVRISCHFTTHRTPHYEFNFLVLCYGFTWIFKCDASVFWHLWISVVIRMINSSRMRWVEHVARMGEKRGGHMVVVEEIEGKRPLARPRRGWGNNINDMQDLRWRNMD